MKIYIVTEGCYSDYHICAVFLSEEEAKIYCAKMCDADAFDDQYYIEEHDTDEDRVEVAPGTKVHHEVFICRNLWNNEWEDVRTNLTLKHLESFRYESNTRCAVECYRAVLDTDDEDKILKIFRDWRAQKEAEEAGL